MFYNHYVNRFAFQREQVKGRTLNVGCSDDPGGLRALGATNLDIEHVNHANNIPNKVDVIGDARELLYCNEWDTIILGDILEHMNDEDFVRSIKSGLRALRSGGHLAISIPEDYRAVDQQSPDYAPSGEYVPGISHSHLRPRTREQCEALLLAGGVTMIEYATIDWNFGEQGFVKGHGFVCS